ncbi:MAG: hypothetical protein R2744_00665 [Bacteroidales bacterium]
MVNLKNYATPVMFDFNAAYLYDYLFYSNPAAGIESLIESAILSTCPDQAGTFFLITPGSVLRFLTGLAKSIQ